MKTLRVKDKIGYGSAAIGDAVAYMFITTFLLYFLTTVAEIQPALAGTLTAIGAVWNSLVNPVIGYLSDNAKTRWGRRRPFMFAFCFPLFVSIILLYSAVEITYTIKVIYYGLMIIAFWTSFTGFFVPFYALGAEYTRDYEERATLRSYASIFNMIGTLFSMAMPTMIVEYLEGSGMTTGRAWQTTAVFLSIVTVTSIMITVAASKKRDICEPRDDCEGEKKEMSLKIMFREYLEVLKLKPMKWLLLTSLFYLSAYAMIMSDFVYMLTYNLGYDGNKISLIMVIRCVIIIAIIPVINKLTLLTDKRRSQIAIIIFGFAGMIICRFLPMESMIVFGIFLFITAITTQTYWQIMPAIFYDVCEYDEYVTGKRREGAIVSVQGLVEAIASGLGAQIVGILLQYAGFNGDAQVQTETALEWIINCTTWVPAIFLIAAGYTLYRFPITKKVYNDIVQKLATRRGENDED